MVRKIFPVNLKISKFYKYLFIRLVETENDVLRVVNTYNAGKGIEIFLKKVINSKSFNLKFLY